METELRDWLLATDPALRWQVQRDLLDTPASQWRRTRSLVATEGFGGRLLRLQDEDGQWAGGAYFPTRWDRRAEDPSGPPDAGGQPWIATSWSLDALRRWGVPATALGNTAEQLADHSRWEYADRPYWSGEVDCCINAATLASGTWLGAEVSDLTDWFMKHQLPDGGWNCEWISEGGRPASRRSSFHSTLNALEGLLYRERRHPDPRLTESRHRGEEYLLSRRLMFRRDNGAPVGPWVDEFIHPRRWVYSALEAVDYFRVAARHDGTAPDPRLEAAIETIRGRRGPDGRWLQDGRHEGQAWFAVDVPPGRPSSWITTHALRVLRWWDGDRPGPLPPPS